MKYKLLVFDIDGTLIDTERTGVLALVKTVKDLCSMDISYEDALKCFGLPSAKVGALFNYPDVKEFGNVWENNFIDLSYMIRPFPGVGETLAALHAQGYSMGIVTSRSKFEVQKDSLLPVYRRYLEYLICSDDVAHPKPYPDPLLKCISMASAGSGIEIRPSDCLYVGDTRHDYECAVAAGCDFALADWKNRGKQGMDVDRVFSDADTLMEIINS